MAADYSHKKLILGGGTAIGAVIFLVIVIGLQYVSLQHPKKWDLTRTGRYTLAPQTKKVLQSFQEKKTPIEVLAFYKSADDSGTRDRTRDLLDQFKEASKEFSYSFVDPDVDRPLAMRNKVDTYQTLVIKAGEKDLRVTSATEETITNALVKLLKPQEKKVYFLKGHGEKSPSDNQEKGFSKLKGQIEKENYKVEELILAEKGAVPGDSTMLVISGAKEDPLQQEIEAIRKYVNAGGKLMVFLNPFDTPNLTAFLSEVGIETTDDLVIDPMSQKLALFGGNLVSPLVTQFTDFPITKDFTSSTLMTLFPDARSVTASKKPVPQANPVELAMTSAATWSINKEQYKTGKADFNEATGKKGPFSLVAVSSLTIPPSESKKNPEKDLKPNEFDDGEKSDSVKRNPKARIVVFGSSLVAANRFFTTFQGNKDLVMNSVSWLAEEEDLISIRPKSDRADMLALSERQLILIIGILFFAPLAWLVAGIIVYSYRKRAVMP